MRKSVLSLLERVGLLGPAFRVFERVRSLRPERARTDDGLPVPPARLRVSVAWTADADWFLQSGRRTAKTIEDAAARHGLELAGARRILDFGCGSGRVARHWSRLDGAEVHGTDANRAAIDWCSRNLPFATFARNGLAPPLAYAEDDFDLAYAVSVFTHLPEDLQDAWLAELRRVVRPGGLLVLTTHGDRYVERLGPDERADYDAGRLVVRRPSVAGTNLCMTFHPEPYVRERLASGFELLEHTPEGAAEGSPFQDLVVLRTSEMPHASPAANS